VISRPALLALLALSAFPAAPTRAQAQPRTPADRFAAAHPAASLSLRDGTAHLSLVTGLPAAELPGQDAAEKARLFVEGWADLLGYDPALTRLEPRRAVSVGSLTARRFAQRHQGLEVVGGDVVVSQDGSGQVTVSNGLERLGRLSLEFTVPQEKAVAAAVALAQPKIWSGAPMKVEQVVARGPQGWRAAWAVELGAAVPLGRWRYFVDAQTGAVLGRHDLSRSVKGYAYRTCPEDGPYEKFDLTDLLSTTMLSGKYLDMYSGCIPVPGMGTICSDTYRQAKPDANGDYLLLPREGQTTDAFAEVMAYARVSFMRDWFVANGFNALTTTFGVSVNFTADQDMACNAQYVGDGIVVGLCWQTNFAYDASVVMHEYTHGAVDVSSALANPEIDDWGLNLMPGGLNEAYADFFPAVALDDARIGKHLESSGSELRNLAQATNCPAGLVGEVHEDGRIWASANWAAHVASGKDPALAKVVLQAMAALSSKASFKDAATATLAAAKGMGVVEDSLRNAYRNQGLLGCGREIGLASGDEVSGVLLHPYMLGIMSDSLPFEAQWKVGVPDGATKLQLDLSGTGMGGTGGLGDLELYVNLGRHVSYANGTPVAGWSAKGQATLVIDAPDPGVYFILLVARNFTQDSYGYSFRMTPTVVAPLPDAGLRPDAAAVVVGRDAQAIPEDAATLVPEDASTPEPPDAAAAVAADAGGAEAPKGCGCAAGPAGFGGLWIVGLALLALRTARRRRG
jgi:Zn-dependent metalloprotease